MGTESCSSSLERGDSRCEMVTHAIAVEECHLFLYRPIDAGVTCVQAYDELPFVIELFYKGELKDLEQIVKENNLTLTTLLVVGDAIDNRTGVSRLYAEEFKHLYRR